MLKSRLVVLDGGDSGRTLKLTELPAMLADRHARKALRAVGADVDGGLAALAFQHIGAIHVLGDDGLQLMMPFVDGQLIEKGASHSFSIERDLKDWRNVERLQQAALLLHIGFLLQRDTLEVPVSFQAAQIMQEAATITATFCSPQIAAILETGKASYRELETVLSTEDVFNLVEILNITALKDWAAHQQTNQ